MTVAVSKEQVQTEIISLYGKYFGSITAKNYTTFYADKDLHTILVSAEELFIEYAGETKGKEIMKSISIKYSLTKTE
ncbi:MAG TPA: hypothetical protein VLF20_06175 [Patescibacteria group bacterium]|nr:hypothetical protein [Patescibacteria group bacterium]